MVSLALLFSWSNRISTGLLQLAWPYCFLGQTLFRQDYYSWFDLIVFSVKPYFDRTIIVGLALLFSRSNPISTGLLQLAWPYCFLGQTVFRQDYYSRLGLIVCFGQTVFRQDYYSWLGLIVFSVKPYFDRTIIVGLALLFSRSNRISTGLLQLAWPYCFLGQTAISTGLLQLAWPYCFLGQTVFRQDYYSRLGLIVCLVKPYFDRTNIRLGLIVFSVKPYFDRTIIVGLA